MKKREELSQNLQWDLSDYFANEAEWEAEFKSVKKYLGAFKKFEQQLNNKATILKCLMLQTEMHIRLEVLAVWANLKSSEDAANSKYEEKLNSLQSFFTAIGVETAFIDVELSANSEAFLNELVLDAELKDYSVYLSEILRHKPHILTKAEEEILTQTGEFAGGFSNVFNKFNDADIKFAKVKDSKGKSHSLSHSNYASLLESSDRVLRKNTMIGMHAVYKEFNNTLAANYIAQVKKDCTYAKLKKFSSALEKSVFIEHASMAVYHTLIGSVKKNLKVFHKYFALKQKTLGLESYGVWDNFASLSQKTSLKLNYKQAIELIKQACAPLGKEYVELLQKAYANRWIDYGINQGKDSGAFSTGAYGKKPVVLISYQKDTHSVFTLAHELGHALHTYYSNTNQPYNKAGYEIFVAEVASNVNEMLLLKHLMQQATSKEDKLFLIDQFMSNFRGSVLRQTMFAEFEAFAHQQHESMQPISADVLNKKYAELNAQYYGKDVMLVDELTYEWSRIPHFYNAFYVYKYATGLISAIAIAKQLLSGNKSAQQAYLNFLSGGCSLPPVELLKQAGVNLENEQAFDDAFMFAQDMLKEWEQLL